MQIALLARRFDPSGGGTERDLMVTAQCLRQAGHRVTVYAAEVRASWSEGTVRRVGLPGMPRTPSLLTFAYMAPVAARRQKADLVLSFARVVGADVLRSGGGAHISYVRAARQWRGRLDAASMWFTPYHRAQMAIERRGFSHPALRKAIAVSKLVEHDLQRQFGLSPERTVTLYNGVDLDRFAPAANSAARGRIRRQLGLSADVPVVVFVGNGFGRKGLRSMLEAWPALKSGAHLLVAGQDRAVQSYRNQAARLGVAARVSFLGAQSRVEDLFHAADAMAMPSLFEPFGNAVMEAMACGLPALTSAQSGVAELIPSELRQFVVNDPSDPREIAARLDALIEAAPALAGAARAAVEPFTWQRYGEGLIRLVESLR